MQTNVKPFDRNVYQPSQASRFYCPRRVFAVLFLVAAALFLAPPSLEAAETTRFGAVLIPSAPVEPSDAKSRKFERPQIVFSEEDKNDGWRVVEGEAHVGVDATRFYFTVKAPGANVKAPRVEVV